jgi:hypothetical protein
MAFAERSTSSSVVEEPVGDDVLHHCDGGRHHVQPGVLIPRARQPVGGDADRQRAPRDETEIAWTSAGHQTGLSLTCQRANRLDGIVPNLGERTAQRCHQLSAGGSTANMSFPHTFQVRAGDRCRHVQKFHPAILTKVRDVPQYPGTLEL